MVEDINNKNPQETAEALILTFECKAIDVAKLLRSETPMYKGLLNPKWKRWDDVVSILPELLTRSDSVPEPSEPILGSYKRLLNEIKIKRNQLNKLRVNSMAFETLLKEIRLLDRELSAF